MKRRRARNTRAGDHSNSQENESDSNGEEEVTRCVCGKNDSAGEMIQCEDCSVWQHTACLNVYEIPKHYFCEECRPEGHPYYEYFKPKKRGKKRNTINSRTADLFDTNPSEDDTKEPSPVTEIPKPVINSPKKTNPKRFKEVQRRIELMIEYFKENEIQVTEDNDPWEFSDSPLTGTDVEIHSKIYHALLRFQANHCI